MAQGIEVRHQTSCRSLEGGRCNCDPYYRASAYDKTLGKSRKAKWTQSLATAKGNRIDLASGIRHRTLAGPSPITLREFADDFLAKAETGEIHNRSGRTYKPSVVRSYRSSMRDHVLPDLGGRKLTDIQRRDVQALADRLASKHSASTVRNALNPLRSMYRYAVQRDLVALNPTIQIDTPAVESRPAYVVGPDEIRKLLDALPVDDQPPWAVAAYAGLRRGEIRALRWENVDLALGHIDIQHGLDPVEGVIDPKSRSGTRKVPIIETLKPYLLDQQRRTEGGLVFPGEEAEHICATSLVRRSTKTWVEKKLTPIGLHECRHTFVSVCIAAGIDIKTISEWAGHGSVAFTLDRYGHLLPGSMAQNAAKLDAFVGIGEESGKFSLPQAPPGAPRRPAALSGHDC